METITETQDLIKKECRAIEKLLLDKNRKYGDSAIHPIGIFSKGNAIDLINTRIDDKLNRIKQSESDDNEDAELDLIGYLILKRVAIKLNQKDKMDCVYSNGGFGTTNNTVDKINNPKT